MIFFPERGQTGSQNKFEKKKGVEWRGDHNKIEIIRGGGGEGNFLQFIFLNNLLGFHCFQLGRGGVTDRSPKIEKISSGGKGKYLQKIISVVFSNLIVFEWGGGGQMGQTNRIIYLRIQCSR